MSWKQTSESKCWQCGCIANALFQPGEEWAPEPESLVLCIQCGAVSIYDANLVARRLTDAELERLTTEEMQQIEEGAKLVTGINRQGPDE